MDAAAPRATRAELDALAEHHRLGRPGVEALLELAVARPSPAEDLQLARRVLSLAGVLSLLAAVVFFLAANWEALGRLARFALVAGGLAAAGAVALWRPPTARAGKLGLLAAFVLTGALLALFGQTYQTGADVHELFFTWAALGLPLVVAGRSTATWGAWVLVLDVALALLCGWLPGAHVLWIVLARSGFTAPLLFVLPLAVNLGLWAIVEAAEGTRLSELAAPWLGRLALAAGFGLATWGAVLVIGSSHAWRHHAGRGGLLLLAWALAAAVVVAHTLRRRRDVFPLAVLAAGLIAMGTSLLVRGASHHHEPTGTVFLITAWLVVSSTAASKALMALLRRWREEGTLA